MSRLTIDITEQQHQRLKATAALQGKTIRQYALERLFPGQADEDNAWAELKTFIEQRVGVGLGEAPSTKTAQVIVDEEFARAGRD